MGCLSVFGGFSGLRLPETLHHRLPQTLEEGEEFGKDWTMQDCCRCIPIRYKLLTHNNISKAATNFNLLPRPDTSHRNSYENIDAGVNAEVEQNKLPGSPNASERIPLGVTRQRRNSMKYLVRQSNSVNTQKTTEGTMQLTYWF